MDGVHSMFNQKFSIKMESTLNSALLIMDMQTSILGRLPDSGPLIVKVAKAIASARERKIPVIFVTVGFRKGAPEISPINKSFAAIKSTMPPAKMEEMIQIHPDLLPLETEIVVTKRRISAFTGSDLEVILRAHGIQHLVLAGISTSGVVLSTIREAADKDYRLTVLSDCCADMDEEVHRVLTAKIFVRQADVFTCEQWIQT
jgi:nicotinamidase-related amidase